MWYLFSREAAAALLLLLYTVLWQNAIHDTHYYDTGRPRFPPRDHKRIPARTLRLPLYHCTFAALSELM